MTIRIRINTKPTSTTNIQIHHFITTLHILNTLQKNSTHSKHRRQKDNTRSKHKTRQNTKQLILIITLQIITIPTSTTNVQIDHFQTTFQILNTLPTCKYINFKTTFMVHCGSGFEPGASGLPYYPTCVHSYLAC